ncbi:hypothetical protein C8R44DRAFT_983061 [Mycena epipterygia]|nr:hypothetical protein C8R44DRAFT_983061 [Mycena epipterygia]
MRSTRVENSKRVKIGSYYKLDEGKLARRPIDLDVGQGRQRACSRTSSWIGPQRIFFYSADKVHVVSGTKLDAPSILRPTKSFLYPDIAAVRAVDSTKKNRIQPVVIIGEGKVKRRGISDNDSKPKLAADSEATSKQPSARAQMAAAVHPTLILVLAHYKRDNSNLRDGLAKNKKFPVFDEKTMVYGVYYDEQQDLHPLFPQVDLGNEHYVIRFYQVLVVDHQLEANAFLGR